MSSGPVTQAFYEWLRKHDEEQAQSECPRSYYDADTGLTDYEQARADELSEAFEGGVAYEQSLGKENEKEKQ